MYVHGGLLKKSKKAYLSRRQAVSKEGFQNALERNISDLKQQCEYEIGRLEKAQSEASRIELDTERMKKNILIFQRNKELFEERANRQILENKAERLAIKKEWAEIARKERLAENMLREAQNRIELAEAIEKRGKR